MTGLVLQVGVLFAELERRRVQRGLGWSDLGVSVADGESLAAGVVPDTATLGVLLGWLGWDRELAPLVQATESTEEAS